LYETFIRNKKLSEQTIADDEASYTIAANFRVTDYFTAFGRDSSTSILGLVKKFRHRLLLLSYPPFSPREAEHDLWRSKGEEAWPSGTPKQR
jgi:hypothetical protein